MSPLIVELAPSIHTQIQELSLSLPEAVDGFTKISVKYRTWTNINHWVDFVSSPLASYKTVSQFTSPCPPGNMASSILPLLVLLNILFFTCVSSRVPCSPKTPMPAHSPPSLPTKKCPRDTLKFGVCGSWLGLIKENIGVKPSKDCCALIAGVADLEAAVCLCTAIKANILGLVNIKVPIAVSLLVNACGKKVPKGFVCAA